jgi:DNA-binding transcriptional ArsR family regulator
MLRLQFGAEDLTRCRFAVSPLCETHEAVRTLRRAERHAYHLPWLRRTRSAAAGLDLSELWLLMPKPGYTPDFLGPPPDAPYTSSASFDEELTRLRATDPQLAYQEIARSLDCTPGADSAAGQAMLADPARTVRRLANLTEQAWHALVAPDWLRVRAVLEADIAYRARKLAIGGLESLFANLHPRLEWADGTLTLRTPGAALRAQALAGRGLLLMPSVFSWPDPVSGFATPWQPTMIYPARSIVGFWQPAATTPATLVRLLGANRATILVALNEPTTTTTLARRHGLAVSSVSAHLSVLRDAGLLTSHREGHHVLYERTALGTTLVRHRSAW